ncbi:hypothetical protein N431DRAFT_450231 [Stipitochalara longipes BDJ]|nr:hypothetical protein N431DRAFT_450231 [Stipitochalara longipes BDJ]
MDQSTAMEYSAGNVGLDEYQENMPVGYAVDGTMAMNVGDWADETTPYSQSISTAPGGIQSESLALLPGFSSPFSQPQDLHSGLDEYSGGTHIDTSFPVYQNATTQYSSNHYTASNTPIQTYSSRTPVIDKNIYCSWDGCGKSHETAAKSRKHWKTHTKPKQCPYSPDECAWKGTAEERELQAHIKSNHEARSDPSFACSNCKRLFTLQKNLIRHQKEKDCYL